MEKKGHNRKQKIGDIWDDCPYVAIGKRASDIPVYDVVKQNARNKHSEPCTEICFCLLQDYPVQRHTIQHK